MEIEIHGIFIAKHMIEFEVIMVQLWIYYALQPSLLFRL
jgi:hypothetical protein